MKRVHGCFALFTAGVVIIIGLMNFPLVNGTPSRFSLFQGSPYSSSSSKQRNKNWCAFVVHKNVSCAVLSNEEVLDPQLVACPPHQDCSQRLTHHTQTRPMYKIGYKQVTELEWRCCPGYQGHDCTELKNTPQKPSVHEEPHQELPSTSTQLQSILGPEVSETHPWTQKGHRNNQPGVNPDRIQEGRRVQALEEEVERLSQAVLHLQATSTANGKNLQEDLTKYVLDMLGHSQQPQDVKAGELESIVFPSDLRSPSVADELQNHISTNANSIQDLQIKIQSIDGQLHRLAETNVDPASECACQEYIDGKISALRDELLQGIDIKLADMKSACEYKVLSVREQCEEQENSYLSLAELLDSKEADLRQQIQDLRVQIPNASDLDINEVQKLKDNQDILKDAIREQNTTLAKLNNQGRLLEARVSLAEKSAEVHCINLEEKLRQERLQEQKAFEEKVDYNATLQSHEQRLNTLEKHTKHLQNDLGSFTQQIKSDLNQSNGFEILFQRLENLEVDFGNSQEQVNAVNGLLNGLDGRVAGIEGVCGRFESMSDSLKRIKDGLNKHVNGLWTCVRQLNTTVLAHTRDLNTFKANSQLAKDPQDGIANAPTGVLKGTTAVKASVEGSKSLSSQSVSAQGVNSSGTSITGYAGAPGYPQIPAAAFNPDSAQIPLKTVQLAAGDARMTSFVSFSAGLTLVPFPEKIGIIRFNKVLLNDGRHYDPNTGVFTAPVDGRYLLSAVLTAEEGEGIEAFLSVSNRNIQKLFSAESDDCECGGSVSVSLPLHLKRGQRAGLVLTAGKLAISTSSEILSSFSAVLLYPTLTQR